MTSLNSGGDFPRDGSPITPRSQISALESELEQVRSLLSSATHLVSELRQENLALKHALVAANEEAKKLQEEIDTLNKKKEQKAFRVKHVKKKKVNKEPKRTLGECLRRARSEKRATVAITPTSRNNLREEGEQEHLGGRISPTSLTPPSSSPVLDTVVFEPGEDVPPPSRELLVNENPRAMEIIEGPLPTGRSIAGFLEETDNLLNHLQSKQTAVNYTAQGLQRLISVYEETGEKDLKRIAVQALDEKKDILAALSFFIANITAKRNQLLSLAPNRFSNDAGNIDDPPLPPPIDDDQFSEALDCVIASMPGKPEPVITHSSNIAPPLPAM